MHEINLWRALVGVHKYLDCPHFRNLSNDEISVGVWSQGFNVQCFCQINNLPLQMLSRSSVQFFTSLYVRGDKFVCNFFLPGQQKRRVFFHFGTVEEPPPKNERDQQALVLKCS